MSTEDYWKDNNDWEEWKEGFLHFFEENAMDRWHKTILYRYWLGSAMDYLYKKSKLLQLVVDKLLESSIIHLVIYGPPWELQKQVKSRNPTTLAVMFPCFRDTHIKNPTEATRITKDDGFIHLPNTQEATLTCEQVVKLELQQPEPDVQEEQIRTVCQSCPENQRRWFTLSTRTSSTSLCCWMTRPRVPWWILEPL